MEAAKKKRDEAEKTFSDKFSKNYGGLSFNDTEISLSQ